MYWVKSKEQTPVNLSLVTHIVKHVWGDVYILVFYAGNGSEISWRFSSKRSRDFAYDNLMNLLYSEDYIFEV